MGIFHQYVSAIADGGDTDVVQPSDWNAVHTGINEHTHTTSDEGGLITIREVLTGDRTYYVSTDGADTDTGLTTDAPFETIQHGLDVAATIDFNGYNVTIQIAPGDYVETLYVPVCVGQSYINSLKIIGDTDTPANVVITNDGNYIEDIDGVINCPGSKCYVAGVRLLTDDSVYCGINVTHAGQMQFKNITFTDTVYWQIRVRSQGYIECVGDYIIEGGYSIHLYAENGTIDYYSYTKTVTISSTDVYFYEFALAEGGAIIQVLNTTFSTNDIAGYKYWASENSVINTYAQGVNYFPGDSAGGTETGGIYL